MTEEALQPPEATVLEIQRMSTEDGPGIRTTVFFKGCGLKCAWCHNPESISARPQIQWIGSRCIGCKTCLEVCPNKALTLTESGIIIDRALCEGCGKCAEECPSTAMELLGAKWSLDALIREVVKDKAYFDKSDGGVTISGGDPTLQARFAGEFLRELEEKDIQTAFDTCGYCSKEALESMLPHVSIALFDLKLIDREKHARLTGAGNEKILDNLVFIADFIKKRGRPGTLWIRTPVIPGATDGEDNIRGIGKFIADNVGGIADRWELCSFNNLCKDKYIRLGMNWDYKDCELVSKEEMERLASVARNSGVDPDIVRWSGSTRLGNEK